MREAPLPAGPSREIGSLCACIATILELPVGDVPPPLSTGDPIVGSPLSRWLAGLGLGLVPIIDADAFAWPGPWIARRRERHEARWVVMYGVPSGVVWDPAGGGGVPSQGSIDAGLVVAATDIALARPQPPAAPVASGRLEAINVAGSAGEPATALARVRALAGRGLEGDRHVSGRGTFPSGPSGSALTLIQSEVCDSFDPPLHADEHRRNLVTRGIDLAALVGREFTVGGVRCRGARLCEPCTVVERYAGRPVLRALVHRGGLRADILEDGTLAVGDPVSAVPPGGGVSPPAR